MEQEEILEAVKLILARYIKENRMRNTPERNAILELFYSLGLLIKHEEGTAVKYEACFGERDYFKTICTRCGKVTRIQAPNVTYAFNNIKYRRFHPEQIVTSIYGICSSCQSKATRMRKKFEEVEAKKKAMLKKNNSH